MPGKHWNTRNLAIETSPGLVPPGLIIMWGQATPPPGWSLCDGKNGTPDLRDRFIVGAGGKYAVGATGGVENHSHKHTVSGTTSGASQGQWAGWDIVTELIAALGHTHSYSGETQAVTLDNRPPYYALHWIRKNPYAAPAEGTHFNVRNLSTESGLLPSGAIVPWHGAISALPAGWRLCNGQGDTPDLRDRFIVTAGRRYGLRATGGQASISHNHAVSVQTGGPSSLVNVGIVNHIRSAHPQHSHTMSGNTESTSIDNRPPYYALAFMQLMFAALPGGQSILHWNESLLTGANGLVPKGLIAAWEDTTPPPGWALCNGQNGTPDLRDRFIVGAGGSYAVGARGGSETTKHSHSYSIPNTAKHQSGDDPYAGRPVVGREGQIAYYNHTHTASGTTSEVELENRPPYYALAFIMKL